MLGGLAIVPFNREFLGAAQLLMSGSMASCYILCYTIACMPAYRDGTSSAAMCAVVRLIVIAASWVGAGVGTLVDDEGLYVIITVTGVSLVAISVVGITRGQRFNPLLLSQEPSGGDVSATDESLRRAAAEHGLSEREETLLLISCGCPSAFLPPDSHPPTFSPPPCVHALIMRVDYIRAPRGAGQGQGRCTHRFESYR